MGSQSPRRVGALIAGCLLILATASTVAKAQPNEPGPATAGVVEEPNAPPSKRNPATVDVSVGSNAPLTALSVSSGSLNCAQGRIVVGKNGKVGFLAPVIGPNVLRGSSDSGSAVSWAVIPLDDVGPDYLNAVTTCLTAR